MQVAICQWFAETRRVRTFNSSKRFEGKTFSMPGVGVSRVAAGRLPARVAEIDAQPIEEICRAEHLSSNGGRAWGTLSGLPSGRSKREMRHSSTLMSTPMNPCTALTALPLSFVISLAITLAACGGGQTQVPDVSSARRIVPQCPPASSSSRYFAEGDLAPIAANDTTIREVYSVMLQQAEQEPLWCGAGPSEAYRFFWAPSVGHAYLVTVRSTSEEWLAEGWVFDSSNKMQPETSRKVDQRARGRPPQESFGKLTTLITESKLWQTPFFEDGHVADGAIATIELREGQRYRAITRFGARPAGFDATARTLLVLAALPVPAPLQLRASR